MTTPMEKVLVTGGAGLIGIHVCRELLRRGIRPHLYDLPEQIARARGYLPEGAVAIGGSILDRAMLRDAIQGCQGVIHLAAYLGVRRTETNKLRCLHINIDGTQNIMDVRRAGPRVQAGVRLLLRGIWRAGGEPGGRVGAHPGQDHLCGDQAGGRGDVQGLRPALPLSPVHHSALFQYLRSPPGGPVRDSQVHPQRDAGQAAGDLWWRAPTALLLLRRGYRLGDGRGPDAGGYPACGDQCRQRSQPGIAYRAGTHHHTPGGEGSGSGAGVSGALRQHRPGGAARGVYPLLRHRAGPGAAGLQSPLQPGAGVAASH
ncbi:MAG: NAD-dependent epimerase/dehydratase family protein [gamma proteobacterium symbiont of Phacoides pectinatus]